MERRQQYSLMGHRQSRIEQKLDNQWSSRGYLAQGTGSRCPHRAKAPYLGGKLSGRWRFSKCADCRLASESENSKKDIQSDGTSGCRFDGIREEQTGSSVLQLEQRRYLSNRIEQSSSRCRLGKMGTPLRLSSVSFNIPDVGEDEDSESERSNYSGTMVAQQTSSSSFTEDDNSDSEDSNDKDSDNGFDFGEPATKLENMRIGRMQDFWKNWNRRDVCSLARQLIQQSWRENTQGQYESGWKRWTLFCDEQEVDRTSPPIEKVLNFLSGLFDEGLKYRTIAAYRSTLSSTLSPVDGFKIGEHPLVVRLIKGVLNQRPPTHKIVQTWRIADVLQTLESWGLPEDLSLQLLTLKTVMLTALGSAKRVASISNFSVTPGLCLVEEDTISFLPKKVEKHTREGINYQKKCKYNF